jgi:hypothetical protein
LKGTGYVVADDKQDEFVPDLTGLLGDAVGVDRSTDPRYKSSHQLITASRRLPLPDQDW